MVNFANIAVFLLGTTTKNGRFPHKHPTYYESRISPIVSTWGGLFPNLYFVFGTNTFDYEFLSTVCQKELALDSNTGRNLRSRVPQEESRNVNELYVCPVAADIHNESISYLNASLPSFSVLYTANCTGEYFGHGPTCRCQETMRYFLRNSAFSHIDWFVFMDDDIYARPYAFASFLEALHLNSTFRDNPIGIVSALRANGARTMKIRINNTYAPLPPSCKALWRNTFYYAQPIILNRHALASLQSGIQQHAMTSLQRIWGGSHDSVLGMLLWIYQIPLYSFGWAYSGGMFTVEYLMVKADNAEKKMIREQCILYHRVLNFRIQRSDKDDAILAKNTNLQKGTEKRSARHLVSQYDIAKFVGEDSLYSSVHKGNISEIIFRSNLMARRAAKHLLPLNASSVSQSKFLERNRNFPEVYSDYLLSDCDTIELRRSD